MTDIPRRWALGGGIGSGKSVVRRLLDEAGVRTVDADVIGHEVLASDAFEAVASRWPRVATGGVIDRNALAEIVFGDAGELAVLEEMTHPYIFGRIEASLEGFEGIVIVELPLLGALGEWSQMVVDSSDEDRIERAGARGMTRESVLSRMEMQPSRAEWLAQADLVVPNHGSWAQLEESVREVVRFLQGI